MELHSCKLSLLVLLLVSLTACVSAPQTARLDSTFPNQESASFMLSNVPFFPQEKYQCGPAALATVLNSSGVDATVESLIDAVYVPGVQGSLQVEMIAAARSHGRLIYQLEPLLADLLLEVQAGNPVLVLQNLGLSIRPQWHFAVVKGFNLAEKQLILNSGTIENYTISLKTFERTWSRAQHWAIVVEEPGSIPITASATKYFQSVVDLQHSYSDEAVIYASYENALSLWPANRELLVGFGNHLLSQSRLAEAAEIYLQTISLYPDYSPALNNLAHTLLQLDQPEQALLYAEKALRFADDYRAVYQQTYSEIVERIR